MTDIKLPEGFIPVEAGLPKEDQPVLAIRQAGYISAKFELVTARYQPTYRSLSP